MYLPGIIAVTSRTDVAAKAAEYFDTSRSTGVETEGAAPPADGLAVVALNDGSGHSRHAIQDVSADRPVLEDSLASARLMALFDDDQHLAVASPGGPLVHFFMVVHCALGPGADRVLATRDTSATTTKAAFEVMIGP